MPTRRIAAAPARIATSAAPRPPHRVSAQRSTAVPALDLWRCVTDEHGDVSRFDDDRIDSRPLELVDLLAARRSHVRHCELARRYVRQELESLAHCVRVQPVTRRQQKDFRVEAFERELELLLASNLDDEVEPQLHCLCVLASEPL